MNLQFTGSITANMEDGFSFEQLADNIFVPSAFAVDIECAQLEGYGGDFWCEAYDAIGVPYCQINCTSGVVILCSKNW